MNRLVPLPEGITETWEKVESLEKVISMFGTNLKMSLLTSQCGLSYGPSEPLGLEAVTGDL